MKKNTNNFYQISNLRNLKILVMIALFSTFSFVFGKFLAVSVGDFIRFSFENLPILLSGILFGPVAGCVTGIVADIVGCILRGYALNPILTFGAAVIGFSSGALYKLCYPLKLGANVFITVFVSHIIGSVIIKSVGLSMWYDINFMVTIGGRALNYLIVASAEFIVLYLLLRNNGFKKQMSRLGR